ncbi:hypothetical protein EXT48_19595 [Pseudoalteromonas sp. CO348]|uniref:hypothetical protein n=1 Tax=Pseudoalteromonas TaxID=53246 RepID=UPI001023F17A|nr:MULTISPECIES: hypothetical protein [Pseudoalteromonas]MCG7539308.1 hypothetical protein [Pseudoalteromonas sp. OF7H-1]QZO15565.1 hypothetical protein K5642_20145 [Pseudoalteromonas piscicida]RZF99746.1 hypothetical protein EXT48_19595 [Pseudoalteromonas sp. CO348]USE71433.1 hypothetical protein CTT31_20325 [Pseudoalteromonas flavipulchra]WMO16489.1 hypothetical protein NI376_19830 [Pseudoalteromonas piscicida]
MKKATIIALFLFISFPSLTTEALCNNTCMQTQTQNYLDSLVTVFIKGSTVKDIDALLSQLHDNVKYEHEEYDADFDKTKWRKAFIKQLELGSFDDTPNTQAKILNIIYGKRHAAVEYSYGKTDQAGNWTKGHVKFALFEFTDKKVSLVREYW